MNHEIHSIECSCGYEGDPKWHDTWVWEQAHPIQGPMTKKQHDHALFMQEMGQMVRVVYESEIRGELSTFPEFLKRVRSGD